LKTPELAMDIGVWMAAGTLEHKLEAQEERNPEQAWNLNRWPNGLSQPGEHRLFVASGGVWRGYFKLAAEALFTPDIVGTPFTLLFDSRTWTEIPPTVTAKRFRGFTYRVPRIADDGTLTPPPPPRPRAPRTNAP
jgi:hypothetical protein